MPRKSTRNAQGGGTIRQRPDGRWEARYTVGRDPGTGKQIQRSVYGSTQKEVRQKLAQITAAIDKGTYTAPTKMTVGQWLDIWQRDYLGGVKPATVTVYTGNIKNHIKPALGAVRLDQLHPHAVQGFVNGLEVSPASVRLAYKVLHQALEKAVDLGYIAQNPASRCQLPRLEQKEIHQGNLGHATAAFTLDRYGHFTERMKQDSAARMESFIKDILNL